MNTERCCPVCGAVMKHELRSGVTVDVCKQHGIWLDKGELARILRTKGRRASRQARSLEKRVKQQGRAQGATFGWMSLFWH